MRLGILGGTFDPPHNAHLIMAEQAREQLKLDRVLWVVAADPPHKQGQKISPIEDRLRMVDMAVAGNSAFEVSLVDVERPGPHYTVDMLSLLALQYPGSEMFLLLGADSLCDLPTWRNPVQLIQKASLAVMQRPGVLYDLAVLDRAIPGLKKRVVFLETSLIAISSGEIRERVAAGRTIRYLLPAEVEAYVHRQGLYCAA